MAKKIWYLSRWERYATYGPAEFIIAKHRNGVVCDIKLRFRKEQMRLSGTLSDKS